eukprot:scaffold31862_cov63-Phaeocystis_antarctica.AAC.18
MSFTTAAGPVPEKYGSSGQVRLAEWTKSSGRSTNDSSKELRFSSQRRELVLFLNSAQASELCAETNRYNAMDRRPRLWENELGMLRARRLSEYHLASDRTGGGEHGGLPGRGWSVTPERCVAGCCAV